MSERDSEMVGAIEIARYWLRKPEKMIEAGFPQVCRELYTVSRALAKLAVDGPEGEKE